LLLRAQQLEIQFADALQSVSQLAVVAQPLLDESFLFGGKADLFGTAAGISDGQDPDGMGATVGANGTAGAVADAAGGAGRADAAVEQGAAEDLGGGGEGGSEFGAGRGDLGVFHSNK